MECKVYGSFAVHYTRCIRIYPEWNVKIILRLRETLTVTIRIYPEWNVKKIKFQRETYRIPLEYIQNGM